MNIRHLTNYMPDWLLFHWMTYRQNQAVNQALKLLRTRGVSAQDNNPGYHSKPGINLIGFVSAGFGLGEAARSTIRGAKAVGIPLDVIDIDFSGKVLSGWTHSETDKRFIHPVTLIHFNPDMTRLLLVEPMKSIWLNSSYKIAYWFWETTQLPKHWIKAAELFDEIWVGSTFCMDVVSSQISKPVTLVPLNIVSSPDDSELRKNKPAFPSGPYTFLTMMDCKSRLERKNPFGAIEAFNRAFGKHPENGRLVVKVINSQGSIDYERLVKIALSQSGIVVLNQLMTRPQVNGLINAIDCMVSLHRSEGFGLPIAEAMALRKPVIATGWSANMDFMTEGNSFPVRYCMTRLKKNAPPYPKGTIWAEPDVDHTAEIMVRLVENPETGLCKGKRASQDIAEGLNAKLTGQIVSGRLKEIGSVLGREEQL